MKVTGMNQPRAPRQMPVAKSLSMSPAAPRMWQRLRNVRSRMHDVGPRWRGSWRLAKCSPVLPAATRANVCDRGEPTGHRYYGREAFFLGLGEQGQIFVEFVVLYAYFWRWAWNRTA
jgi:hypothetical protein